MPSAHTVGEKFAEIVSRDPDLRDRLQPRVAAAVSLIDWSAGERDEWLRITGRPLPSPFDLDGWLELASLAGISADVLLLRQDQLTTAALVPIIRGALERLRRTSAETSPPSSSSTDRPPAQWSKETANPVVTEYLRKHGTADAKTTIRQIAKATGIPRTTIGNTAAWKAYQRRWDDLHPPAPKAERLGKRAETLGKVDPALQRLIEEQSADDAADNHGRRPRL